MKDDVHTKIEILQKESEAARDKLHIHAVTLQSYGGEIASLKERHDIHRAAINGLDKAREDISFKVGKIENDNIHMTKFIENISESLDNFAGKFETGIKEIVAEIAKLKENNSSWHGMASVLKFIVYFILGSGITYLFEHIK